MATKKPSSGPKRTPVKPGKKLTPVKSVPKKKAPAKKAPPKTPPPDAVFGDDKNADLPKKRQKHGGRPDVHALVELPEPDTTNLKYLRFAAGIYYTQDLNDCRVLDLKNHPQFSFISDDTLEYWCTTDQWVARRKEHKEMIRGKIAAQVGDKLAQARIKQLQTLERIYDIGVSKIEAQIVDANSWEGVVNALTKLAALMDDYRGKIAEQVVPTFHSSGAASGPPAQVRPKLTEEEAREAATLIIQKRRNEMRARLDEHLADDEDDEVAPKPKETPALKVLTGKPSEG